MLVAFLVSLSVLLCTCVQANDADPMQDGAREPASESLDLVMDASRPRTEVDLRPEQLRSASEIEVSISAVSGAEPESFAIQVNLVSEAGAVSALDRIAPFPIDRGGTFTVRLPESAKSAVMRGTRAVLRFELVPAASDRPLPAGLRVTLGAPVLR